MVYIKKEKELAQRTGSRKVAALTTSARIRVAIFTVAEEPGTLCLESRKSREAKHGQALRSIGIGTKDGQLFLLEKVCEENTHLSSG